MAFCKKPEKHVVMEKILVKPNYVVIGIIIGNPKTKKAEVHYYDEEESKEATKLLTKTDL